ncbi:hypothetical protein LMG27177_05652 [Paraburkholderia fynbosensis]|uniref:Uncharacterized protein n=1 Tax=Paraburkholderia fynbosensis TaxID=1200993 RepID=A0A6J5GNT8_9BURK|nr:hypothetical protein LMG27177_05652 [Paraburkholderia fynbosensis]
MYELEFPRKIQTSKSLIVRDVFSGNEPDTTRVRTWVDLFATEWPLRAASSTSHASVSLCRRQACSRSRTHRARKHVGARSARLSILFRSISRCLASVPRISIYATPPYCSLRRNNSFVTPTTASCSIANDIDSSLGMGLPGNLVHASGNQTKSDIAAPRTDLPCPDGSIRHANATTKQDRSVPASSRRKSKAVLFLRSREPFNNAVPRYGAGGPRAIQPHCFQEESGQHIDRTKTAGEQVSASTVFYNEIHFAAEVRNGRAWFAKSYACFASPPPALSSSTVWRVWQQGATGR